MKVVARRPKSKAKMVRKATDTLKSGRLARWGLSSALMAGLKSQSGRRDIDFAQASKRATGVMNTVPITKRAGYPVVREKGSVDPAAWRTINGVKVEVDFRRAAFLPDTWGQGVKITKPTAHSTGGTGGTYTVFMSPDGQTFYHQFAAEAHAGRKFTLEDGLKGQLRAAWLQGEQQWSEIDTDNAFFKGCLTPAERKKLPPKKDLHIAVVSARRANKPEGVRDIAFVETAFRSAGVEATWYVDAPSLKAYRDLGVRAVVGGPLTQARNKALADARRKGKLCVQISDDISSWEYRKCQRVQDRSDYRAMNAAYAAAKVFVVNPVAAARFIAAKMRSLPKQDRPKLGGVYMLGSCARTLCGDEFSRRHFIIGDFFVVDTGSKVNFSERLTLKEDYDFTCSHIKENGSVLRCNRMTIQAKHYSNSGGAVAVRNGKEERKNIGILMQRWPQVFHLNSQRRNEVLLRWPKKLSDADQDDDADGVADAPTRQGGCKRKRT